MCSLFVRRLRSRRCCSASFPSTAGCCSAPCSGCSSVAAAVVQRRLWLGSRAVTHGARVLSGAGCVISVRLCSARDGSSTARTPPPPPMLLPTAPPTVAVQRDASTAFPRRCKRPSSAGAPAAPCQCRDAALCFTQKQNHPRSSGAGMDARAADQPPYPEASPPCCRSALRLRLRRPLARRAVLGDEVQPLRPRAPRQPASRKHLMRPGRTNMPEMRLQDRDM